MSGPWAVLLTRKQAWMHVLFFAKAKSFPSENEYQALAISQPVENWLQRLEDFAVKTSQFAQRKRALPKRASLLPMQGPLSEASTMSTLSQDTMRTAGDASGGEQIVMIGKSITAQGFLGSFLGTKRNRKMDTYFSRNGQLFRNRKNFQ